MRKEPFKNILRKEENADNWHFLLYRQYFLLNETQILCFKWHLICHLQNELFLNRQIFDSSKLKEFADNNFEFDENGRQFSKRVENSVGKGEIARSPFLTVFSKDLYLTHVKTRACLEKSINSFNLDKAEISCLDR